MIEVAYVREKGLLQTLSQEVRENIVGILEVLDAEYGADRNKYVDDGGYVIAVERKEDFNEIKDKVYIYYDDIIPEYVEKMIYVF